MRITTQAMNLRRRYLFKRSRIDVIYFEPLDTVYSNKTDGRYTTSFFHEPMNTVFLNREWQYLSFLQMTIALFGIMPVLFS